jgi:hypothetical protein
MPRGKNYSIDGVEATVRAIGKAAVVMERSIVEGLQKCGQTILKKSQTYVPVETGALKASGKVETTGKGFGARVFVRYGGSSSPRTADYAPFVHENMEKYHKPPTQAKFLERAVRETRGTCASIMRRTLESGVKTVKLK